MCLGPINLQNAPLSSFDLTKFLAIWGAVLSTFGLGWNFYRDFHDRAKLRVTASLKRFAKGADGRDFAVKHDLPIQGATNEIFLVVSMTNIGRRPVMIKSWGGKWRVPVKGKRGFTVVNRNLPKMLTEGQYHLEYTNDLTAVGENVKTLYVWDSSGKEWKLPRRELTKLKEEASLISAASSRNQNYI